MLVVLKDLLFEMATEASMRHALKVLETTCEEVVKQIVTEKGLVYARGEARRRLEYVLDDTGIKGALICRAKTIDHALRGKMESAEKNYEYMTRIETVEKLESDLLQMRTQLSLRGIDRKARVLASLFDVTPWKGSKVTSTVVMSDVAKEKFKNGSLRVADDCELWTNVRSTEMAIELEEAKRMLATRQEDLIQTRKAYQDVLAYAEKLNTSIDLLKKQNSELSEKCQLWKKMSKQKQLTTEEKVIDTQRKEDSRLEKLEKQLSTYTKLLEEQDKMLREERSERAYIEAKYNTLLTQFASASEEEIPFDQVDGKFKITIECETSLTSKILSMATGYGEIKRRYKHAKKLIKSMANMAKLMVEIPDDNMEKEVDETNETSDVD